MGGKNIGDLLNAAGVTWGFFMGGFDLTHRPTPNGTHRLPPQHHLDWSPNQEGRLHPAPCSRSSTTLHRQSDAHAAERRSPRSGTAVTPANHQYDMNDFFAAVKAGNFPAVSFLKAPAYQDGHAGYSDPLDEQTFVVTRHQLPAATPRLDQHRRRHRLRRLGRLVRPPDGSDREPVHQPRRRSYRQRALCGDGSRRCRAPSGNPHAQGRCGYGPRQPLLVISPWARHNFVDHTVTDRSSIIRFVEDNWLEWHAHRRGIV